MALPRIGADAELRLDKWTSNVQKMMADATNIDSALLDLVGQANKTEAALNDIKGDFDVNMAVTVDDGDIEGAISLKEMLEDPTSFVASADESDINAAIGMQSELDQNTFFTAGVNDTEIDAAKRKQSDLDSNTNFRANVNDSELTSAKRKHDDLDANTDMKVNVDDSEIDSLLTQIRNLQTIEVGISLAGSAAGLAGNVANATGLPGLFEMDNVLKDIEGTTGRVIPNLDTMINQLYSEAWGESRTQIGGIVAEASRLGISMQDLEGATRKAFALSDIMGQEPEIILRAMDRMVDEGIVPDMATAADIFTTTFQKGGDAGEDMMDTMIEYAPDFAALRMNGEQVGGAIVGGIEAGFMNSDYVGDSFKELNIRIDEWARDRESQPIFSTLNLVDETEAFNAGTLSFEEYMSAIEQALAALPEDQQSAAFLEIFGTPAEGAADDWETFLNGMIGGFTGEWQGAMDKASAAVEGDIGTSFTSLRRTIEVEFADLLNNAIDVEGLIEDMRVRIGAFAGELATGATLGSATESAFGGTFIADIINGIEAIQEAFMDMVIAIMGAVADVVGVFDKGAAKDIREAIADLAEMQLTADIFTAGSFDQIAHDIEVAVERGVNESDIASLVSDQLTGMTDSGDFGGGFSLVNTLFSQGSISEETRAQLTEQVRLALINSANDALETGDFSSIAADDYLADLVRPEPLSRALKDAFETGMMEADDLIGAWNVAENLGNALTGGESTGLRAVAQAIPGEIDMMFDAMEATFNQAIDSGDLDLAQRIADTTDIPAFQSKIDEMIAATESVEQPVEDTMQASSDATGDFADDVDTAADDIDTSTEHVKGSYEAVETASGNAKKKVKDDAGDMSTDIDTMATDVGTSGDLMEADFDDVGISADDLATKINTLTNAMVEDMTALVDTTMLYRMTSIESYMAAGDAYSLLAGRMAIDTASIIGNLELAQMEIASLGNVQINIPVPGGGGVTNNNQQSTTNVNITNNNNSQAAATASSNAAAQLLGH